MVEFGHLVTSADLGEAVPRGAARRVMSLLEERSARARSVRASSEGRLSRL